MSNSSTGSDQFDVDVLIVGAGPAGLTAAAVLAEAGVRARTITKYGGTAHSPRAHITNQRTMEVLRDLGLEQAVREVAVPNDLMGNNVWSTSLADPEIARLMTWGSGPERKGEYDLASPCAMCNIPQHRLEPILLDGALAKGADIRFNTELVSLTSDADGATATVRDRSSGEESTIRARYLIGADGGRSIVAEQAGIAMDGEMGLGAAVNVWLEADLTDYTAHRPGTLYWMTQPGNDYWVGSGTWICVTPWTEWVLLFMYDPAEGEPDLSEEALVARAHTTIGDPEVDVRIKAVSTWQINHMVAETYRSGPVFIAGDAAHRHPPANGLGTNTSMQDAFNLAWKIAQVVTGKAGEGLLDSYDAERRPVGRQVVDRAMKSVGNMSPIAEALGFEPGQDTEAGRRALEGLKAPGQEGAERRRALREAIELQNYQFNALGVEIDQRYADSPAVLDDGTAWPRPTRDPELHHHPTTHPGARLPHAWLGSGKDLVSTLDLTGHGRFTLLTGPGGERWLAGCEQLAAETGIEVAGVQIGAGSDHPDIFGRWAEVCEIEDDGALLVRPDHHIAWRSDRLGEDPAGDLRTALEGVLDRRS